MKKIHYINRGFKYDIKNGIARRFIKFIPLILFCFIVCFTFLLNSIELTELTPSFADYYIYLFKGMNVYDPTSRKPFTVPYIWLFLNLYIAFLIGNYPQNDLSGTGSYLLIKMKSRKNWWICKCLWNITTVVVCYILIFLSVIIISIVTNGVSMTVTGEIQLIFSDVNIEIFKEQNWEIYVFILPFVTSVAISIFQMSLSFFIKPIFSYVFIIVAYIASAYYAQLPIGNYSMFLRSSAVLADGYSFVNAIMFDLFFAAISAISGLVYFKRYNILGKLQG